LNLIKNNSDEINRVVNEEVEFVATSGLFRTSKIINFHLTLNPSLIMMTPP